MTIPAGSILAFRVAQLLIDPKWGKWQGPSLAPRLCDREAGNLEGFSWPGDAVGIWMHDLPDRVAKRARC